MTKGAAKRLTSPGLVTDPPASGRQKVSDLYVLDEFYCPALPSVNERRRIVACFRTRLETRLRSIP